MRIWLCFFLLLFSSFSFASADKHKVLLKEMFQEVTIKKNAERIKDYYHPDFRLYSNGDVMDFETFFAKHQAIYQTPIEYNVQYQDETFVLSDDNKVAARIFIRIGTPDNEPSDLEIILIAQFKEDKIFRLWEISYPDWRTLKSLGSP